MFPLLKYRMSKTTPALPAVHRFVGEPCCGMKWRNLLHSASAQIRLLSLSVRRSTLSVVSPTSMGPVSVFLSCLCVASKQEMSCTSFLLYYFSPNLAYRFYYLYIKSSDLCTIEKYDHRSWHFLNYNILLI